MFLDSWIDHHRDNFEKMDNGNLPKKSGNATNYNIYIEAESDDLNKLEDNLDSLIKEHERKTADGSNEKENDIGQR